MKFGLALHISIQNRDYYNSFKIINKMKQNNKINLKQDLMKVDDEGDTLMHVVMRNFNFDYENS